MTFAFREASLTSPWLHSPNGLYLKCFSGFLKPSWKWATYELKFMNSQTKSLETDYSIGIYVVVTVLFPWPMQRSVWHNNTNSSMFVDEWVHTRLTRGERLEEWWLLGGGGMMSSRSGLWAGVTSDSASRVDSESLAASVSELTGSENTSAKQEQSLQYTKQGELWGVSVGKL